MLAIALVTVLGYSNQIFVVTLQNGEFDSILYSPPLGEQEAEAPPPQVGDTRDYGQMTLELEHPGTTEGEVYNYFVTLDGEDYGLSPCGKVKSKPFKNGSHALDLVCTRTNVAGLVVLTISATCTIIPPEPRKPTEGPAVDGESDATERGKRDGTRGNSVQTPLEGNTASAEGVGGMGGTQGDSSAKLEPCKAALPITVRVKHGSLDVHPLDLAVRRVRWSKQQESVADASECGAGHSPKCAQAKRLLDAPDVTNNLRLERLVMRSAMQGRRRAIPILFILMICGNVTLLVALLKSLIIPPTPPADDKIPSSRSKWAPDRILLLRWVEVVGPALGFALTVIGLSVAFDSASAASNSAGRLNGALATAMSSTLLGLLMMKLASTVRTRIEFYIERRVDGAGLVVSEAYSYGEPSTATAEEKKAPATGEGTGA